MCSATGARDWRVLGDGIGARSMFARVTWEPAFGTLETSYRQLDNEDYGATTTRRQDRSTHATAGRGIRCSSARELTLGRDVFGDSYSRLGAFIRF